MIKSLLKKSCLLATTLHIQKANAVLIENAGAPLSKEQNSETLAQNQVEVDGAQQQENEVLANTDLGRTSKLEEEEGS
jgi:hypothetical protein